MKRRTKNLWDWWVFVSGTSAGRRLVNADKIRAAVKHWAPRVSPVAIGAGAVVGGAVVGATLMTLAVRALAAAGASKGDLVIAVAGVIAVASANVLWWWFRGRDQASKVRAANQAAAAWSESLDANLAYITTLEKENTRLNAEVERLTRGEVVSLLHQRMGDQT